MSSAAVLSERLGRRFDDVIAVDAVDLEVASGEVFGLLGHNGAGKTTTVRLLNGILAPTSGSARVLGLDPTTEGAELRARTGVLTESHSLDFRMTARETLRFFAAVFGVDSTTARRRADELLERFELSDRADDPTGEFSKGMRQRLAIARALIHEPELLFLDEPTAALDPIAARGVDDLIVGLSREQGTTVIVCTHNLTEAQRVCDRVAVMERGSVIAVGAPRELARAYGEARRVQLEVAPGDVDALLAVFGSATVISSDTEAASVDVANVGRDDIPGLVRRAVGAGINVFRVTPDEPTLEDVYFALHAHDETAS